MDDKELNDHIKCETCEMILLYLKGTKKSYKKCFELCLKLAEEDDKDVQYFLATRFYLDGFVVEKDVSKAIEWLRKSADLGHPDAAQFIFWEDNKHLIKNPEGTPGHDYSKVSLFIELFRPFLLL